MSVLNYSLFPVARIGRFALMLILALALFAATLSDAEAQSRRRAGVAIGVGILGAIILDEAARSERRYERYNRYNRYDRYYDDDHPAPRRSSRRNRKQERYSEPSPKKYSEPVRKKKKTRSASQRKSKTAPPVAAAAVQPPADEETVAPATEQAAAAASPDSDNSYLPQADRKAAPARTTPKARDLPPVANAAPTQAMPPQADDIRTPDEIRAAQQHLNYMGYDVRNATGVMDTDTRNAISAFQSSIGAEPTGVLTYDQLQALFEKAASLAAKPR